jgi:rubrerythrin
MHTHDFTGVEREPGPVTCPHCGASDYEDNRIDERIYVAAAQEAHSLRHEGRLNEVVDILSALYTVRIVNFIRHPWRCLACGVHFDG